MHLKMNTHFSLLGGCSLFLLLIKQCHVGSVRTMHQIVLILFSDKNMCHYNGLLAFKPIASLVKGHSCWEMSSKKSQNLTLQLTTIPFFVHTLRRQPRPVSVLLTGTSIYFRLCCWLWQIYTTSQFFRLCCGCREVCMGKERIFEREAVWGRDQKINFQICITWGGEKKKRGSFCL